MLSPSLRAPSAFLLSLLLSTLAAPAAGQAPFLVKDVSPGDPGVGVAPLFITPAGDLLFFWGFTEAEGQEVWVSDGTAPGTFLLRDLVPGPDTGDSNGSDDNEVAAVGDLFFFAARDSDMFSGELWRSDGTPAGTIQLTETVPGPGGLEPEQLTPSGALLFFLLQFDPGAGLWRSDGTPAGTFAIDLGDDAFGSALLTDVGGTLYFFTEGAGGRFTLWRSDGTQAGTTPVTELPAGWNFLGETAVLAGTLFVGVSTDTGFELWKSDGTAAGTVRVKDFGPGADFPEEPTPAGGQLFFRLADAAGAELWASDGTTAGTRRVADIRPGSDGSFPFQLAAVGSTLYFGADDGVRGFELWKSDGTAAGTALVADVLPGAEGSFPLGLTGAGGLLFFSARDGEVEGGLWRSDGTAAGTFRLGEVMLDSSSTEAGVAMAVLDGTVYFSGEDGMTGRELWAVAVNSPPVITSLAVAPVPAAKGAAVTASAAFSDPDPGDLLAARLFWGDGTSSTPDTAGGTLATTHAYARAGLYTVTLRLTDSAGAQASRTFEHAVVYDPAGPAVNGDGTIATHQGQATFQVAADYVVGRRAPQGGVRFILPGLDLRSLVLRWLVVRGGAAWIEGEGTINGRGRYRFRAFAFDPQATGGSGADRFRIRIHDLATGALAYDSEPGAPDDATPRTPLASGAIQIQ